MLFCSLQVIYLVRDPRAVVTSRVKVNFISLEHNFESQIQKECGAYNRNINLLLKARNDSQLERILQRSIIVIRYEDVIQDSYGMAKKIYNFLDLHMPFQVEEFAKSSAKVNVWGKPDLTKRMSEYNETKVLQQWKSEIGFSKLQMIQEICGYSMDIFGYRKIEREDDMQVLNFSLTGKVYGYLPFYTSP